MNWDGTLYKPTVAWRTEVREAVLVSYYTVDTPSIYKLRVSPIDITNPGAVTAEKKVGYYLMDYLGHIYRIIEIDVDGDTEVIKVSDDFRWDLSPINGKQAIVYKSVGDGFAPWLAATYGSHLYYLAANTAAGIDNAILWKMSERVLCENTDTPSLTDYQNNYLIPYGDRPKVRLFRSDYDNPNNLIAYSALPRENYVGGKLDSIDFGQLDEVRDWIIEISR